ncbi:hypothetical protein O6H91_02G032800 [Diphasiastrum complanatum]|uniref:Uncharacterized protein n=1 Tax=Diphasiastrum complanatum TaxID=34168 RepID=A0ACC2EEI2_DIPCM|nr:hypothetical protein O6H91_02G032800 [Diphasiastrum complanatum]
MRLRHLRILSLSMNQLSSEFNDLFFQPHGKKLKTLPEEKFTECSECAVDPYPQLQVLDLSYNFLTGVISEKLGQYANLREVRLGNNRLTGAIPASLGSLRLLAVLSLENNLLESSIPVQLNNCHNLQYLDVSNNLLAGEVPAALMQLQGHHYLNLSNNRLKYGRIPHFQWIDQKSIFRGNTYSSEWPLRFSYVKSALVHLQNVLSRFSRIITFSNSPAMQRPQMANRANRRWLIAAEVKSTAIARPAAAPASSPVAAVGPSPVATAPSPSAVRRKRHTARRWALGLILGLRAGILSGMTFGVTTRLVQSCRKKSSLSSGPTIFHPHIKPKHLAFLEKEETLMSQSNFLGKGASGQVYKACLQNRMVGAIKIIPIRSAASAEEETDAKAVAEDNSVDKTLVRAELETVGQIRHKNLVALLAYVIRPDAHLLIYQYMWNGSLYDVMRKVREGEMELNWSARYRIAVNIATGLKYLHFDCSPRIVHRDIKPSNILLDEDMEAHLGDFGLARQIPDDKTHITTGVSGTVGYIPPEYHQTCRFTEAGDMYSFGVVLAVLLTGREPTDESLKNEPGGSIIPWMVYHLHEGTIEDVLDPKLADSSLEVEKMKLVIKVALFCTLDNATERPSSKDVLAMLEQIPRNIQEML